MQHGARNLFLSPARLHTRAGIVAARSAILGSSGFLEISTNKGAASRAAGADKGSEVTVTVG